MSVNSSNESTTNSAIIGSCWVVTKEFWANYVEHSGTLYLLVTGDKFIIVARHRGDTSKYEILKIDGQRFCTDTTNIYYCCICID